jgi:hypothetical protein
MPLQGSAIRVVRPPASQGMEVLQAREIALREGIAKMRAQRPILERQARSNNALVREQSESQLLQMDLQTASAQAELESVQEQIAVQGGRIVNTPTPQVIVQPPRPRSVIDRIDNDAITAMFVATTLAILIPLSIGLARRLWRRAPIAVAPPALDGLASRMERIEHAVDAIAIEIERVSESQRFVAKVLIERPSSAPSSHAHDADKASGLGDAKPFLALGAGPMEPIPVAQRQAVKQTVTPH